jgi:hypothetical protein
MITGFSPYAENSFGVTRLYLMEGESPPHDFVQTADFKFVIACVFTWSSPSLFNKLVEIACRGCSYDREKGRYINAEKNTYLRACALWPGALIRRTRENR